MKLRPIPITVKIIQGFVPMAGVLLLGESRRVVLLRPSTLNPFPTSHARVRFVEEGLVDLAVFIVPHYVHLWNTSSDALQ